MKLQKGIVYNVVESLEMLLLQGRYIGIASRSGEDVLVFESRNRERGSKYFAAKWVLPQTYMDYSKEPKPYLRSCYYANNLEELGITKQQPFKLK